MSIGDPFTGFTIGTINPATQGLCTPTPDGPCDYVKLVICYPEGMDYCFETLLHHNLGTADDGFYNTGNKNIGDYNYGRFALDGRFPTKNAWHCITIHRVPWSTPYCREWQHWQFQHWQQ